MAGARYWYFSLATDLVLPYKHVILSSIHSTGEQVPLSARCRPLNETLIVPREKGQTFLFEAKASDSRCATGTSPRNARTITTWQRASHSKLLFECSVSTLRDAWWILQADDLPFSRLNLLDSLAFSVTQLPNEARTRTEALRDNARIKKSLRVFV